MVVDRPQPARWLAKKFERRHQHQPITDEQASDARADQPHVVIQRQPRDEGIGAADSRSAPHCPHIGKQVGVAEHDAFGVAGAAGGVLKERRRLGADRRARDLSAPETRGRHGRNRLQRFAARAQQVREGLRLVHRDQQPCFGVAQDSRTALQMVFELRQARWRIQRHRDTAGVERAVERREEFASGRQHDGHRVTGAAASLDQACSDRERVDAQPCIASGASSRRAPIRS